MNANLDSLPAGKGFFGWMSKYYADVKLTREFRRRRKNRWRRGKTKVNGWKKEKSGRQRWGLDLMRKRCFIGEKSG